MSETLAPGLTLTRRYEIDTARTIAFMGDECRVYSTPALLYDIEVCCRDLLLEHIGEGKDSVGTRIELDHVGATLLSMWIEITVKLVEVNGAAVTFEFTARDALEEVARGRHNRFIVGVDKTRQRLLGKLEKARSA
ncbi:MAG TPA: LysR family transcriptional regulator [Azoarcus taiwanensis]|uniref:LysR family transcriptional regulator n=1 Tax=Azoarcus taiwanensis TaxID=666964 RepID=A0A972F782_9RHOO|nr:LysR family transcriptional regulator [Azoarcus taiwanensis]NMG02817.1 LysR family transcriptional regulator [Azoarcus taiwanensis]HRQ55859.1 LysR family transcriptional regulator [Azoarcus taiwanensis]